MHVVGSGRREEDIDRFRQPVADSLVEGEGEQQRATDQPQLAERLELERVRVDDLLVHASKGLPEKLAEEKKKKEHRIHQHQWRQQ